MTSIALKAPAKVNLFLEVLRRRADGYCELRTLMQTVGLYDELLLREAPEGIEIRCDPPGLPTGEGNLVWRAAREILSTTGGGMGVRIELRKRIPVAAGLGGGSSDAAATLHGINRLLRLGKSRAELIELGSGLGSDVPFFLFGGLAFCTGRGERVEPLAPQPVFWVVLVNPRVGLSTRRVYADLDFKLTRRRIDIKVDLQSLRNGEPGRLGSLLFNSLEEPAVKRLPRLAGIKRFLLDRGAEGAAVSGSGPTVYAVCRSAAEAERIGRAVRKRWGEELFTAVVPTCRGMETR